MQLVQANRERDRTFTVSWWDGAARHWMVAPLAGGEPVAASADVPHAAWNELDDHPDLPPPYGSAGWTEDDQAFLFYDRYDVWRFEPASGKTTNLTGGAGRVGGTAFATRAPTSRSPTWTRVRRYGRPSTTRTAGSSPARTSASSRTCG